MFTPFALRIAAVMAMLLAAFGLVISLLALSQTSEYGIQLVLASLSWALLLWAALLGFQLAGYKLYPDEYRKVGFRIYLIVGAFFIFWYAGVVAGVFLSVALLAAQWGLKRNYDDWVPSEEASDDQTA